MGQVPPVNDDCQSAILIADARQYCSENAEYSTVGATESLAGNGKDVWFKFVPRNFEVRITVTSGTLQIPEVKLYEAGGGCISAQRIASVIKDGNLTILSDAGLNPNKTYYVSVSGAGNGQGTFKLCIETFQSQVKPGQDFTTATVICNTLNVLREVNVLGAGANQNELQGACFDEEKHSAWYKWTAANSGSLVFTISPSKRDDIDWVLFELGPEGAEQKPSANNIIRCAAGHGIDNSKCPNEEMYTLTGLDFNENDINESAGCGSGQNGMLKAVTMKEGYVYALIVNNFSVGNNGFDLAFTDRTGKAGTGLFKGPEAVLTKRAENTCTPQQSFTFSAENLSNYKEIKWYFGEGASIEEADTPGPHTIRYSDQGLKTVVLQLTSSLGCTVVYTESFEVGITPRSPVVGIDKSSYCLNDTVRFRVNGDETDAEFHWAGPDKFESRTKSPTIVLTTKAMAGQYTLTLIRNGCSSIPVNIVVPPIADAPIAAFTSNPPIPAKLAHPITVTFTNQSANADAWLWDFGDNTTSTDRDPEHTYTANGNYTVTLTAYRNGVCESSISRGTFMVSPLNAIFIPNTFTPNNDQVNDEFVISINNVRTYRINIYNRFGVPMYMADNPLLNWDGTYENKPVPTGTYYYLIEALDFNGNTVKKSGSVTVLR